MERRTWASCLIRSMDSTANTSIPKVLDHCFRETSQYGPPYLVMEYLPGSPASSLSLSTEQQRLVLQQLAFKMAELYHQTPFSAIGQISRNPDHFGDFWVGPDPETGEGPFYKASDYYKAVSKHRFGKYIDEVLESNLAAADTPGMHLPLLFEYLMPAMSHDWYSEGPFGIWNTDPRLLDHTMLDAQLNFVGWSQSEHLMPRPVHAVGQIASHFRIAPPGLTFDSARMNDLVDQMAFHEYIEATKKRERELTKNGPCVSPIADALDSYGSQLFRGLNDYTQHDRRTNKEWFRSFWYMYWERNRNPQALIRFPDATPSPPAEEDHEDADSEEDAEGHIDETFTNHILTPSTFNDRK